MASLLITNATIVNEGSIREADILVKNGRIERVDSGLTHIGADKTLDVAGKTVLPGMIDDQVHFREPGLTHKADMASESRAALAGGITSFMEMPNCNPLTITHERLEAKCQLAAQKSAANYAFYLGASNDNLEQIKSLDPRTACGVKVFMGASTGNMLVDDPHVLEQIFIHSPTLIATHCEDTPTILANEARFKAKYGDDIPVACHPLIRSEEACYLSSSLAVSLAKKHGSRLHVLHLTTAKELELFAAGQPESKRITVEACVHHLFFNDDDYADKGNLIKCNPAIKTRADQVSLQNAVKADVIDVIATDHAPHTWDEKQQPYIKAPAGLPLVQHALLSLLEQYHKGIFDLELIARKTSHAPATLFNVADRGFIREGYWADLVVVDLNKPTPVTRDSVLYKCGWSPFEGYTFRSSIETTVLNGEVAYHAGEVKPDVRGQRLQFNR